MSETVLFVGGGADGKRIGFPASMQSVSVAIFKNNPHFAEGNNRQCYVDTQTYRRVAPHCYLISTESPDNLIPLLIEGYRRKE